MLSTLRDLFEDANKASLLYAHWKSNEHLAAALDGQTDLDILVAPEHWFPFSELLISHGFSEFDSVGRRKYIGITDYLRLDEGTGKILHVHLHDQLRIGRKFLKEFVIPCDRQFLDRARLIQGCPVRIADKDVELAILWLRRCLRSGVVSSVLRPPRRGDDTVRESDWLESKGASIERGAALLGAWTSEWADAMGKHLASRSF